MDNNSTKESDIVPIIFNLDDSPPYYRINYLHALKTVFLVDQNVCMAPNVVYLLTNKTVTQQLCLLLSSSVLPMKVTRGVSPEILHNTLCWSLSHVNSYVNCTGPKF